ncbi:hypothetical protein AX16_003217 [Volvariella volvacea WC 439]|nr:hypothetical protein AX16_003217 [Volvariella volvacea WC 439]
MVARNPLFSRWTAKKFQATVINDIWPEMIFFSLIATMVVLVSEFTDTKLSFDPGLLTVLGTVLGLVINFRTSSAYERYQDGRKMWTAIAMSSRNLAQMIWVHAATERPGRSTLHNIIEKKTMVNLVQAFSVALKHFLRGEAGVYYRDLFPLISALPRYAAQGHTEAANLLPLWQASEDAEYPYNPQVYQEQATLRRGESMSSDTSLDQEKQQALAGSRTETATSGTWTNMFGPRGAKKKKFDPEQALPDVFAHRPLRPARDPPETTIGDYFPFIRFFRWVGRMIMLRTKSDWQRRREEKKLKKLEDMCQSNVPLEIVLFLSSYTAYLMKNKLIEPAIATGMTNNLQIMQDTMSQLERIGNTPLPFAYQAHLRLSLWLYLFFLPFQIYAKFKYLTIPGTAFATFLLVGFLEIGQEIENPFNYDLNDLDLDSFCLSIQRELHEITAHTTPDPASFIFTHWNKPFAPTDRRSATEIIDSATPPATNLDGAPATSGYTCKENEGVTPGMESLRSTLVKNWRQVDRLTRDIKHAQ